MAYSHHSESIVNCVDRSELCSSPVVKVNVACQDQRGCPAAKKTDIDDYGHRDSGLLTSRWQDGVLTHLH